MKNWLVKYAEPLTYLAIFILLSVSTFDFGWVAGLCVGVAWFLVLHQWDQVKKWRKRALYARREQQELERILQQSGFHVVSTCGICKQDVLDFDEHYKKVHMTEKEKR